ncbi:hypothetical protein [Photobacterium damselae]|uniref:hypothetical protein n=1 Tax=Photobacterium damselae TaxID=38293 RepID=UPI004067A9F2
MARTPRLQIPITDSLYKELEEYKIENNETSVPMAAKSLIEFALLIKKKSKESAGRTTRELLEEILLKEYQNEKTINQLYLFHLDPSQSFSSEHIDRVRVNLKSHKDSAIEKVEQYLENKA